MTLQCPSPSHPFCLLLCYSTLGRGGDGRCEEARVGSYWIHGQAQGQVRDPGLRGAVRPIAASALEGEAGVLVAQQQWCSEKHHSYEF